MMTPRLGRPSSPGDDDLAWDRVRLSVVIPIYNEVGTVETLLRRVRDVPLWLEVIAVDDGSTDGTRDLLPSLEGTLIDTLVMHEHNQGKGAALRTGFKHATGDVVVVQDADMEYDPLEFPLLLKPILSGKADAVYGSRFLGGPHRVLFFWHSIGNRFLTLLSNMFTDLNLTDMETCYKAFRGDIIRNMILTSNRFGIEPELTARLAQAKARIYELPISYDGRSYEEGKKIGWKDGVSALWCILKYNLIGPKATTWAVPEVAPWNTPERLSSISVGRETGEGNDVASQATPTGGEG
jgi:glycosyltransferase involved in cell wall biosynthesis